MFIQTQPTPNPLSLMFYARKSVMEVGSIDFPNAHSAMNSPFAKVIFRIDGITRIFFRPDFVTVMKSDDSSWELLKPEIFAAIMDFYSSGQPLFLGGKGKGRVCVGEGEERGLRWEGRGRGCVR
ncbi:hypothetical protein HN51_029803 [Arachis hypogaea]